MEALASKELTSTPSPAQRRTVPSSSSLESRLRPVTATSLRLEPLLAVRPSTCITNEQRMPKILVNEELADGDPAAFAGGQNENQGYQNKGKKNG